MTNLIKSIDIRMARSQDELDTFKVDLDKDPAHAFIWGNGAVNAAATLKVLRWVKKSLATQTPAELLAWMTEDFLQEAKHNATTTSPMADVMENAERRAKACAIALLTSAK